MYLLTVYPEMRKRERHMALEDYMQPEIAVTAVVTAAVVSPRGRKLIRKGAVYGLAGVLIAGDALGNLTRGITQGVQQAGASVANAAQNVKAQAETKAASVTSTPTVETPSTSTTTGTTTTKNTSTKTPKEQKGTGAEGTGGM